jgi:hypothetical protein
MPMKEPICPSCGEPWDPRSQCETCDDLREFDRAKASELAEHEPEPGFRLP